jgi:DNA replication protein DnaC
MTDNALLESYLRELRLPTFAHNYARFAQDAAQSQLDFTRFLLALAEAEVNQREQNQRQRRIKAARFPVQKELADFDFSAVPALNKSLILDLARGAYLLKRETVIFIGHPGLGKTHLATALALEACCIHRVLPHHPQIDLSVSTSIVPVYAAQARRRSRTNRLVVRHSLRASSRIRSR